MIFMRLNYEMRQDDVMFLKINTNYHKNHDYTYRVSLRIFIQL
jgi:hypothetical protein